MITSNSGIELIKKYEGFRNEPYLDPVGIPTIGYGFTYYPGGRKVKMNDQPITRKKGEEILKKLLEKYEYGVLNLLKVGVNQLQFDALVSFSYNVGLGALQRSTLLRKVNVNPDDESIRDEFLRWNKARGKTLLGLQRRRKEEADLYFGLQ